MKNVLIVDDDELIVSLLAEWLKSCTDEWNILTAANGRAAVKVLDAVPVDLVVTDIDMPEMDGYQLLTYTRKNKPGTLAVVMTADYGPEVMRRLLPLGVVRCFQKPFSFVELAGEIATRLMPDMPQSLFWIF